ncbi:hypothetical protein EVAR_92836_1 [Eumeta japonica]|uniref:Uncharacterized protein n=1 Tax=Eumeta variegata TaxID=151549 RepID=A0A4C1TD25_EUMVA|nr:hypothetical protein EVAR_92836_1 [Eumeta japonica]
MDFRARSIPFDFFTLITYLILELTTPERIGVLAGNVAPLRQSKPIWICLCRGRGRVFYVHTSGHTFDCTPDPTSVLDLSSGLVSVPVRLAIQFRSDSILVPFAILCPAPL